jgi:hypothetical protein
MKMARHRGRCSLRALQRQFAMDQIRKYSAQQIPLEGKKCEKCGAVEELSRHHLSPNTRDVRILCWSCHVEEEQNKWEY